jgi:hypothetical protein
MRFSGRTVRQDHGPEDGGGTAAATALNWSQWVAAFVGAEYISHG